MKNIIASYNPAATKRVMLTAHWDSRPFADKDGKNPSAPVPYNLARRDIERDHLAVARADCHDAGTNSGTRTTQTYDLRPTTYDLRPTTYDLRLPTP